MRTAGRLHRVPQVIVHRATGRFWAFNKIAIAINGQHAGVIGRGRSLTVKLEPGSYTARASVGISQSNTLTFDLRDDTVPLVVRPNGTTNLQFVTEPLLLEQSDDPVYRGPGYFESLPSGRSTLIAGVIGLLAGIAAFAFAAPTANRFLYYVYGAVFVGLGCIYTARFTVEKRRSRTRRPNDDR